MTLLSPLPLLLLRVLHASANEDTVFWKKHFASSPNFFSLRTLRSVSENNISVTVFPLWTGPLSRLHTSKFSLTSFNLTMKFYLLVCKAKPVRFFLDKCIFSKASMLAFEQGHLLRKKLTSCRNCWSVLGKKIEKLRVISGVILVFALMTTSIKKLCNCIAGSTEKLLKPANIICQGKACHRKLVIQDQ